MYLSAVPLPSLRVVDQIEARHGLMRRMKRGLNSVFRGLNFDILVEVFVILWACCTKVMLTVERRERAVSEMILMIQSFLFAIEKLVYSLCVLQELP